MTKKIQFINSDAIRKYLEDKGIHNVHDEIETLEKEFQSLLNRYNKKDKHIDDYNEGVKFLSIFPNYETMNLPSWILHEIENVNVIGNTKKTLILPDGRKYHLDNKLNHLTGAEWTYFTNSVINTTYRTNGQDSMAHHIRKIHPTPKPPQLMANIIEFFTKENEIVLDYFMGVGGSLLGAALCNRRALGIEINEKYIEAYKESANELNLNVFPTICGDSLSLLQNKLEISDILRSEEVGLILIDPPYGNMMNRKKTGADVAIYGNVSTPFSDSDKDLGNLDLPEFFDKLKQSVEMAMTFLKTEGYVVVFIKDLQPNKKEVNLLHSEIINTLNSIDKLQYKGLRIWADQTSKLFPYGYPFSFVANQIHQYILIFRKEK